MTDADITLPPPAAAPEVDSLALTRTLVDQLMSRARPELALGMRLAAVTDWFDVDTLAALRGEAHADGLTPRIFDRISHFSFVSECPGAADRLRLRYSPDVRTVMLAYWDADPNGLAGAHRRAIAYLEDLARRVDSQQAVELHLDALNHRIALEILLGTSGDGVQTLVAEFEEALEVYHLARAESLLAIGRRLQSRLPPAQALWIDYIAACLEIRRRRFADARTRLTALLARPELTAGLRPRVQSALGDVLVEGEDWHAAVQVYQSARKAFQHSGELRAAARTMVGLAHTHLDLAYNIWGQRQGLPAAQWTWRTAPGELFGLISRIPILIYLLLQLGPALLTSIWQIARGQDWLVARLFVTAADWLRQAEGIFLQVGDQNGAALTRGERARLYLALGDPWRAAYHFEMLITHPGVIGDDYRLARVRLGLSAALVQQHRPALALEVIDRATQVFEAYRDTENTLNARFVQGQAHAALQQAAPAVSAFRHALNAARDMADVPAATEIAHALAAVADQASAPAPGAQPVGAAALVEQARALAASVPRRTYLVPYAHPWLYAFNRLSLWFLAAAIFLIPVLTIRPMSAVDLVTSTVLRVSPYIPPSGALGGALSPVLQPEMTRLEAEPQFHTDMVIVAALLVAALYMVAYTVLGLILVVRTPLRQLQTGQSSDVTLDEHGITQGQEPPIAWADINAHVVSELLWRTECVPSASYCAVLSGPRSVTVPGHMPYYAEISAEIARRVPPSAQRGDYRYSLLHGFHAGLFGATALYIVFFALASVYARNLVTIDFIGPYSLADLFTFAPLGLLISMIYWLITGPLRAYVLVSPRNLMPWAVGVAGMCLAIAGLAGTVTGQDVFGRPDVLPTIAGVTLGGIAVTALWRARTYAGVPAYSKPLRSALLAVFGVTTVLTMGFVGLKLLEYHYMVVGDYEREQGRAALVEGRASEAPERLGRSASAYGNSLAVTNILTRTFAAGSSNGDTLNARGIVYTLLGAALGEQGHNTEAAAAWEAAVQNFAAALSENPQSAALYANRGVAYEGLSRQQQLAGLPDTTTRAPMRLAVADFMQAAERDPHSDVYPFHAASIYLMLDELDLSRVQFEKTLSVNPSNAAAHTGIGFVLYLQAVRNADNGQRSALLNEAILSFSTATRLAPREPAAFTGLGYAYYARDEAGDFELAVANFNRSLELSGNDAQSFVMRGTLSWLRSTALVENGRTPCRRTGVPAGEIQQYRDLILDAIVEYSLSLKLQPDYAPLIYRRGQLHYLLARCPGESYRERYEAGLADTEQAIQLDPTQVTWYTTAGNFHYGLSLQEGHDYTAEIDATIDQYRRALDVKPNQAAWHELIGDLQYYVHDEPGQDALARLDRAAQSFRTAVDLSAPGKANNTLAKIDTVEARRLYLQGDYSKSILAAGRALELNSKQTDATLTLGLALFATGNDVQAGQVLSEAVKLVDAIADPVAFPRTVHDVVRDLQTLRSRRVTSGGRVGAIDTAITRFQELITPKGLTPHQR